MKISDIPQQIKQYLLSESANAVLNRIITESGLQNPTVIPNVLSRLLTKEFPAHDFVETLTQQEGGLNPSRAAAIARAVKEKLLEGERYALFQWGIDISDIKVHDAPSLKDIALEEAAEEPKKKNIEISNIGTETGETAPVPVPIQKPGTTTPKKSDEAEPNAPFILHEEKKQETVAGGRGILGGFSMPLGFFKKPKNRAASSEPVRVKIEAPEEKKEKRVVNYSELRTSLSPFEGGGDFIRTRDDNPPPTALDTGGASKSEDEKREPLPSVTQGTAAAPTETATPEAPAIPSKPATLPQKSAPSEDMTLIKEKPAAGGGAILGTIVRKPGPKVDGNVIDLKS